MKNTARRVIFAALASAAMAGPLVGLVAASDSAISGSGSGPASSAQVAAPNGYGGVAGTNL